MFKMIAFALALFLGQTAGAISGGEPAVDQVYRFARLLEMHDNKGGVKFCTGTLLQNGLVLTSARCVINAETGTAFSQIIVRRDRNDKTGMPALHATVHPQFEDRTDSYDIAFLHTEITDTDHALLPIESIFKTKYADQLSNITAGKYAELMGAVSDDEVRMLYKGINAGNTSRTIAQVIGFGQTCLYLEDCPELPTLPNVIKTAVFLGRYVGMFMACSLHAINHDATPNDKYCLRTDALNRQARKGDIGAPLFVFNSDGEALVIGIQNTVGDYNTFGTNLAGFTDFLKTVLTAPNSSTAPWIDFDSHSTPNEASNEKDQSMSEEEQQMNDHAQAMANLLSARFSDIDTVTRRLYDPKVNFYNKPYTVDQIIKERQAFAKRWPLRTYTVVSAGIITCSDNRRDVCQGTYDLQWMIRKQTTIKRGTTRYSWTFKKSHGQRVVQELGATN